MNPPIAEPPPQAAPHPYRWVMLFAGWLAYVGFGLTANSLGPLVPQITRDLGISHTAMGFVLGAWQLVYIGSAIACGAFLDRYGIRRGFLVAGLCIVLSGVLRAWAQDLAMLLLAVGVFGLGGPLISSGVAKLVSQWFSGDDRSRAMGIIVTGASLGAIASLTLTQSTMMPLFDGNWRAVLLAYAGFMLAATLLWMAVTRHPEAQAIDRRTAAEKKAPQLHTLKMLLALPAVRIVLAMSIASFAFNHGFNNWMPELLRHGGMTPGQAGYWAAIPVLAGVAASPLVGRFATAERRLAILMALLGGALAATILLQFAHGPLLIVALMLQGFSRGALSAVLLLVMIEARGVGEKNAGAVGGLYFTAGEIGGMLGPVVIGTAYDLSGSFASGLAVMSFMMIAVMVMLAMLKRAGAGAA